MAWDSKRPVPWKRVGIYIGIYTVLLMVITVFGNNKANKSAGYVLTMFVFAVAFSTVFLVFMVKMGWAAPLIRTRAENVAIAQERRAASEARRAAKRGTPPPTAGTSAGSSTDGPRPKAVATSRTSTGMSQHPRHTSKSRKR